MQNRKLTAIIIIVFALIILTGLIYFLFLAPVPDEPPVVQPVVEVEPPEKKNILPVIKKTEINKTEVTEEDLKRLSGSFVERYGSYSNQSNYSNMEDLELFMSKKMQNWINNYIKDARAKSTGNEIYYGLTTKSVVVETIRFDEFGGTAEFIVKTQRKESIGSSGNVRTFQQDAKVVMIKEGGAWKVSGVFWKE